jgi:hypothetical protein
MWQQTFIPFSNDELYGDQWEYLFLASPQQKLMDRILGLKEDFSFDHNHKLASKTWPHITLANFRTKKSLEPVLVKSIRNACNNHRKFTVDLCDFDGFDHYTIYIKVQQHQPFLELGKSLNSLNEILWNNTSSIASIVNNPHLTIAKRIPYRTYIKAIQEYREKSFRDVFILNELILFRRRHREAKCQRVASFYLS